MTQPKFPSTVLNPLEALVTFGKNMIPSLPLGELLTEAGLISKGQLQTALYDQQSYNDMLLGEILVTRGWISQKTIDFFVEFLQRSRLKKVKSRLGDCFVQAALIDQDQVDSILKEQELNHVRFGSIAVLKGYISQETLDFFLKYVFPQNNKIGKTYWQVSLNKRPTNILHQDYFTPDYVGRNVPSQKSAVNTKAHPERSKPQVDREAEIRWI